MVEVVCVPRLLGKGRRTSRGQQWGFQKSTARSGMPEFNVTGQRAGRRSNVTGHRAGRRSGKMAEGKPAGLKHSVMFGGSDSS